MIDDEVNALNSLMWSGSFHILTLITSATARYKKVIVNHSISQLTKWWQPAEMVNSLLALTIMAKLYLLLGFLLVWKLLTKSKFHMSNTSTHLWERGGEMRFDWNG